MGLGLLLGALGIGAICGASSQDSFSNLSSSADDAMLFSLACAARNSRNTTTENAKVAFFDKYRKLDVYLGRLVGEGGGGITLLINAIRHQGLNTKGLRPLLNGLVEMRNYRNILAHSKNRWRSIPNPSSSYSSTLDKVRYLVDRDLNNVAHALRKQYNYAKSRRR